MTAGVLVRPVARLRAAAETDRAGLRLAFSALLVSCFGDLLAGLTLGAITGTLADLPGLLVLVPAAIGMRGNIFGALGSRLGTAIHTGTFRVTARRDTLVGQNIAAAILLTLFTSGALAVLAKALASAFGVSGAISLADFFVISVLGGVISSLVVLPITLGVAAQAARRQWDLDNVSAPLVTAAGDVVTLPSLFLATFLVGHGHITEAVAVIACLASVVAIVVGWRSRRELVRRIVRQSVPVLVVAGAVDVVAGLTIEHQLASFVAYPALLVLVPPFLEETGALGGILSSRLSSKLHLGIIDATGRPQRAARDDFFLIGMLAVPVFLLVAVSAELASLALGFASPGWLPMIGIALTAGIVSTAVAVLVAYYGSVVTYRLGFDPDNYGIPLLTSSMDLVASTSLIVAIIAFGVG